MLEGPNSPNKDIPMKASISVANYQGPMPQIMFQGDLDPIFAAISQIGYQGVDLFLETSEGVDAARMKELLKRHHLEVSMLQGLLDLVHSGLNMSHPDAAIRKAFLDRSPCHLKLASSLGAMVPIGFSRGNPPPGVRREDHKGWFIETVEKYHKMAHDLGVTLILEPINRYEMKFINTAAEAVEIVETLRLPNLKLLLDSFHMNIEEASIPLAIWKAKDHIAHFHFVDSNRRVPGYGHTDMKEIFRCLKGVGYQGFLGLEAEPKPEPLMAARFGIEYLRLLMKL
jgi:5-keto-L-gluconate epimerase